MSLEANSDLRDKILVIMESFVDGLCAEREHLDGSCSQLSGSPVSLAVTAASGQSALPAAARAGVLQRTLNVKSKVNLLEREAEKKYFYPQKIKVTTWPGGPSRVQMPA